MVPQNTCSTTFEAEEIVKLAKDVSRIPALTQDGLGPAIADAIGKILVRYHDTSTKTALDYLIQHFTPNGSDLDDELHNATQLHIARLDDLYAAPLKGVHLNATHVDDSTQQHILEAPELLHFQDRTDNRRRSQRQPRKSSPEASLARQERYETEGSYYTYHYPILALDHISPSDCEKLVDCAGGKEEHLQGKSCYCQYCFENGTCASFTRVMEGYRHVREAHVPMEIVERYGGYVMCPHCTKEFIVNRLDTMKTHLVKAHCYPDEPVKPTTDGRRVQHRPSLDDMKDPDSASAKVIQVRDCREARFGEFNMYKILLDEFWRNNPNCLRIDVKTERMRHNAPKQVSRDPWNASRRRNVTCRAPGGHGRRTQATSKGKSTSGVVKKRRSPNNGAYSPRTPYTPTELELLKRLSCTLASCDVQPISSTLNRQKSSVSSIKRAQLPALNASETPSPEPQGLPYGYSTAPRQSPIPLVQHDSSSYDTTPTISPRACEYGTDITSANAFDSAEGIQNRPDENMFNDYVNLPASNADASDNMDWQRSVDNGAPEQYEYYVSSGNDVDALDFALGREFEEPELA